MSLRLPRQPVPPRRPLDLIHHKGPWLRTHQHPPSLHLCHSKQQPALPQHPLHSIHHKGPWLKIRLRPRPVSLRPPRQQHVPPRRPLHLIHHKGPWLRTHQHPPSLHLCHSKQQPVSSTAPTPFNPPQRSLTQNPVSALVQCRSYASQQDNSTSLHGVHSI